MKIDLFKLNNLNYVDLDEDFEIDKIFYENMDIIDIKNLHASGNIKISFSDEIECNLLVNGVFVLPCAITLEPVEYEFSTNIEEIIGKFEDFYNKNKNTLEILPFIWENIVSEVPIRVVKSGIEYNDISGDGWELVSEDTN